MSARRRFAAGGGQSLDHRPLLIALAAGSLVVACATAAPSMTPVAHHIDEPYQALPFVPSQSDVDRAAAACAPTHGDVPVAEARGGSMLHLVFDGPGGAEYCLVAFDAAGDSQVLTGGGPLFPDRPRPAGGGVTMESSGNGYPTSDGGAVFSAIGRAGPDVARVEVVTASGKPVQAAVGSTGWWAAWWPGNDPPLCAASYGASGNPLAVALC
jgi:hypothetical protein